MASDDTTGPRPGPVVLRIKLRYDDVETMVQRFAPNVGKSGLFLPTRAIQPLGTQVKFELRISDDTPVLVGLGKVVAVREPDPADPRAVFGMAIELMRVSREGGEMIKRMIAQRRALGLRTVAIPMPEDLDAARKLDAESEHAGEVRTPLDGIVREALPTMASAPVSEQVVLDAPSSLFESGPVGVPRIFTSADSHPVAALAPEAARPQRPRMADVIARATELSGPLASLTVPGLDDQVDVARAIARARSLASGDLDAELAALCEQGAAPIEITLEAASSELARQLGGAAVTRKERSGVARWAPPPAVQRVSSGPPFEEPAPTEAASPSEPPSVPGNGVAPAIEPEPPSLEIIAPDAARALEAESASPEIIAPDAAETAVDAEAAPSPFVRDYIELTTDPGRDIVTPPAATRALALEDNLEVARVHSMLGHDAAEIDESQAHELDDQDIEPLDEQEHTLIGALPIDLDALEGHSYASVPRAPEGLADRLDEELADAEAEVDAEFSSMQRTTYGERESEDLIEHASRAEDLARELASQQPTQFSAESAILDRGTEEEAAAAVDELAIEEIDDFDVLAVADADEPSEVAPAPGPEGSYDFAANLDLDDSLNPGDFENERHGGFAASFRDYDAGGVIDPSQSSAYDPPSGGYTVAEDRHDDYERYGGSGGGRMGNPRNPDAFGGSSTVTRPARPARPPEPRMLRDAPDDDLEIALQGLDPDLDDLSRPHPAIRVTSPAPQHSLGRSVSGPAPQRSLGRSVAGAAPERSLGRSVAGAAPERSLGRSVSGPAPEPVSPRGRPPQRAVTDDGILIDFDDDES